MCRARRQLDEMVCTSCHLRWDVNDPEPPPCDLAEVIRKEDNPHYGHEDGEED